MVVVQFLQVRIILAINSTQDRYSIISLGRTCLAKDAGTAERHLREQGYAANRSAISDLDDASVRLWMVRSEQLHTSDRRHAAVILHPQGLEAMQRRETD